MGSKRIFFKQALINRIKLRKIGYFEHQSQILNAQELATLWHPPGYLFAGIKNMAWGKTCSANRRKISQLSPIRQPTKQRKILISLPRLNLKTKKRFLELRPKTVANTFISLERTGVGKSTLIANMAIDDIRKGRGVGIIDPHGDLSETILDFIPKRRMNDVVYLEPFDTERPFSLNVLEIRNKQQKDLVASGIVSIFNKLYKDSWGPRLEYILRNVI